MSPTDPQSSQTAGATPPVDVSHATPELVSLLSGYFAAKSRADLSATMAYFSTQPLTYVDATLGWIFPSWEILHDTLGQFMPNWPKTARSYPTRILGDTESAVIVFTSTPELFGAEIRAIGSVNFGPLGIERWVDYWDGRHYGVEGVTGQRTPEDAFPSNFQESTLSRQASPVMEEVVAALSAAFASADADAAAVLFTDDASFEDLALRSTLVGRKAITTFLRQALSSLPYGGEAVSVRHTLGSAQGGGYEWIAPGATVPRGVVALELDSDQRISRLTSVWDGSLVATDDLGRMLALTIES